METIYEVRNTSNRPAVARPSMLAAVAPAREYTRIQELFAWIGIVLIGLISFWAMYTLWVRSAPGI